LGNISVEGGGQLELVSELDFTSEKYVHFDVTPPLIVFGGFGVFTSPFVLEVFRVDREEDLFSFLRPPPDIVVVGIVVEFSRNRGKRSGGSGYISSFSI
jgi:hypothetical protein